MSVDAKVKVTMPQPIYHFVFIRPGTHRSQRDKELEDARIRSHAAKVCHTRQRVAIAVQSFDIEHEVQCMHGNKIAVCPVRKAIAIGTYDKPRRCLGGRDPFGTYPGHNAPAFAYEVADYGQN